VRRAAAGVAAAEDDVLVVGSGFCGLLVARELLAAGRQVAVVERGALKPHAEQLRDRTHEVRLPTSDHNHEPAPGEAPYPWNYVYGVGGSSLHWTGVAPRLLPSDFRLRSEHGVGRDWPLGYEDLAPYYADAERLLHVAGSESPFFPGEHGLHAAHPLSPADRLVEEPLAPFHALPQARPTAAVNGRPPCCGNTNCELCPVDSRQSMLHLLEDERLLDRPGLRLLDCTVVARLRLAAGRVDAVECVDAGGEWTLRRPRTVVLAAGGIENAAILLRSGAGDRDAGRWLFDHGHRLVHVELDRPAPIGRGAAHVTGASYAWADGPWRSERASLLALVLNQGVLGSRPLIEAVAGGRTGSRLHDEYRERVARTLGFDVVAEDLPSETRRVELSPHRDAFGLPRSRITYGADSSYLEGAVRTLVDDLETRLKPLGARVTRVEPSAEGSHQLGTAFMGDGDGVVDRDLRHHRLANLFVAGGSAFPSYSAHHPTLTICALALRLGRALGAGGLEG
jgi:choline dehydrogenase-like flavoprotein